MTSENEPVISSDISHLFRPRTPTGQFSVWYDFHTKKITGISPHEITDTGDFLISNEEICITLLNGEESLKEYLVEYDPNIGSTRVMHQAEYMTLVGTNHDIQLIDFSSEEDPTKHFSLIFYKNQNKCELMANHASFINMLRHRKEEYIALNQKVIFFARDKNTGYLLSKHEFKYMSNDILEDNVDWLTDVKISDIEILSYKNFCSYVWTYKEDQLVRTQKVNRKRVVISRLENNHAHLHFQIQENNVLQCKSHIIDPNNYNITDSIILWITKKNHPDALINQLVIPTVMIKDKNTFGLPVSYLKGFYLKDLDFLTDNQYIDISLNEGLD